MGESDGTVNLWKTAGYSHVGAASNLCDAPVACLTFLPDENDYLVAVDWRGTYQEFKLTSNGAVLRKTSKLHVPNHDEVVGKFYQKHRGTVGYNSHGKKPVDSRSTMQISSDGRTVAYSVIAYLKQRQGIHVIVWNLVFRFDGINWTTVLDNCNKVSDKEESLKSHLESLKVFSLAKDGSGFIATYFRSSYGFQTVMYPLSGSNPQNQRPMAFRQELATWGSDGDYLVTWKIDREQTECEVSVYPIKTQGWWRSAKRWTRRFKVACSCVKIKAIRNPDESDQVQVLVANYNSDGGAIVFLWDIKEGIVTQQANMSLSLGSDAEDNDDDSALHTGICDFASNELICTSRDGKWIGRLSRTRRTCALFSVEAGAIVWSYMFPHQSADAATNDPTPFTWDDVEMGGKRWIPNGLEFDSNDRHLVVRIGGAVYVLAPRSLNPEMFSTARQTNFEGNPSKSKRPDARAPSTDVAFHVKLQRLSQTLSAEAFDFFMKRMKEEELLALFQRPDSNQSSNAQVVDIISAAMSPDRNQLAYISRAQEYRLKICFLGPNASIVPEEFPEFKFQLEEAYEGDEDDESAKGAHRQELSERFLPWKVRFYPTRDRSEGLVVLPRGSQPVIVFCNQQTMTTDTFRLNMAQCLAVVQSEDRQQLCLLDVSSVTILNLAFRTEKKIRYKINFDILGNDMEAFGGSWENLKASEDCYHRRISEDGQRVLLACDPKQKRSIVATPSAEQAECLEHISDAGETIDFDCTLSPDGQWAFFFPYDEETGTSQLVALSTSDGGAYHIKESQTSENVQSKESGDDKKVNEERKGENESLEEEGDFEFRSDEDVCFEWDWYYSSSDSTLVVIEGLFGDGNDAMQSLNVARYSLTCAEEFIPGYDRMIEMAEDRSAKKAVSELVKNHGVHTFNESCPRKTLAQKAVLQDNDDLLERIEEISQNHGVKLALDWKEGLKPKNLLQEAVNMKETNCVGWVFELMRAGVVPFDRAATCMKDCWKNLCDPRYRDVLDVALSDGSFISDVCPVEVPVQCLQENQRKEKGLHIGSADSVLECEICEDPHKLGRRWKCDNAAKGKQKLDPKEILSTHEARLRFVCIEDAAKPGMDGIIRPLLLSGAPARFFQSDPVKWVINLKWHKYWQGEVQWQLFLHMTFLVLLTIYVSIVGSTGDLHEAELWKQFLSSVVIICITAYGAYQFREEVNQLWNLASDGHKLPEGGAWHGIRYYFSYRWNIVDLVSSTFLLIFIPILHCCELFHPTRINDHTELSDNNYRKALSVFVAVETLVAYLKVWYHAQAFQSTGGLVLMIDFIFQDAFYFLGLAFVVVVGFALGLRFLLRHAANVPNDPPVVSNSTDGANCTSQLAEESDADKIQDAFGSIIRSVETLFYALLGDFDRDIYDTDNDLGWLISGLFAVYLISLVILLLNLLISTMGDTYENVKSNEDNLLLMNRAKFIDGCEAGMSSTMRNEVEREFKKYVHVVSKEEDEEDEEGEQWGGRLNAIDFRVRKNVKKLSKEVDKWIQVTNQKLDQMKLDVENKLNRLVELIKQRE